MVRLSTTSLNSLAEILSQAGPLYPECLTTEHKQTPVRRKIEKRPCKGRKVIS